MIIDAGGPVLVEGPVEVRLPDGSTAVSDRFLAAICVCRRSRTQPWCDTSHRRRGRPAGQASPAEEERGDDSGRDGRGSRDGGERDA